MRIVSRRNDRHGTQLQNKRAEKTSRSCGTLIEYTQLESSKKKEGGKSNVAQFACLTVWDGLSTRLSALQLSIPYESEEPPSPISNLDLPRAVAAA